MASNDTTKNHGFLMSSFATPLEPFERPIPRASSGTVVVKVLATFVFPYTHKIHDGLIPQLNMPIPCVPHPCCVARVHEASPDAALLKPGDLVWGDGVVRARDDATIFGLQAHLGGSSERNQAFMKGEWRDGTFQQYTKLPLENCFRLDEDLLINRLGYTVADLSTIVLYETAIGAILDAGNLKPGQTAVMGPATGSFGGATAHLALAAGANVIAIGRNLDTLVKMKKSLGNPDRLHLLAMTGNVAEDAAAIRRLTPLGAGADVFNDWTPGWLPKPLFLDAGMQSLKAGGRIILSGSPQGNVEFDYNYVLHRNLSIQGRLVTSRPYIEQLINMISVGALKIGRLAGATIKEFELADHQAALAHAEDGGISNYTVIMPNGVSGK